MRPVAYGDGVWVAVGRSGTILRSLGTASTWKDVSLGSGTFSDVHFAAGRFVSAGRFVAGGQA